MDVQNFIPTIAERLQSSATVKNIYGEPIERDGKTIIPVARIRYGFGGGMGTKGKDPEQGEQGGGGGGGVNAIPVGVLEVTSEETRLIPFNDFKKTAMYFVAGIIFGLLFLRKG